MGAVHPSFSEENMQIDKPAGLKRYFAQVSHLSLMGTTQGFKPETATRRTLCGPALLLLLFGFSHASPAQQGPDNFFSDGLFYSTAGFGTELFSIQVHGRKVTTTDIGPTNGGNCTSLAMSSSGILYSVCGPFTGPQQLATLDLKTGQATLFGDPIPGPGPGLNVMATTFGPNGVLYAVGDCVLTAAGDCGADPNFNSLYSVNVATGVFTLIGSTGAPQYFMDLAFDAQGNLFGVTTTLNPSLTPATLYLINTTTGAATKVVDLVGSNSIMGLAFGHDGQLYANDYVMNPGLYVIDIRTGFETAIAALPFSLLSALKLAVPVH
jgi:hypothetical protein